MTISFTDWLLDPAGGNRADLVDGGTGALRDHTRQNDFSRLYTTWLETEVLDADFGRGR